MKNSCEHWSMGIYKQLDNREDTCQIPEPEVCWFDIADGLLDLTKLFGKQCRVAPPSESERLKLNFYKAYKETPKRYIGMADSKKIDLIYNYNQTDWVHQHLNQAKVYDSLEEA